jgi:hypothetical protein
MNNFAGDWTKIKIEILGEYAKAYLMIMKDRPFFKLMYFDGFAGSGFIVKDKKIDVDITVGTASHFHLLLLLTIRHPLRAFFQLLHQAGVFKTEIIFFSDDQMIYYMSVHNDAYLN